MTLTFKFLQDVAVKKDVEVVLGAQTSRKFFTAPKNFHVMGIVKFGLEFGLLARTIAGDYIQINGSNIKKLDKYYIEKAIQAAKSHGRSEILAASLADGEISRNLHSPVIFQKKHRKIDVTLMKCNGGR